MQYTIASRGSKLALYQANYVCDRLRELFPEHTWNIQTFTTTGDRFLDRPLSSFGGKGAFLKELEEAMLSGKAHLAVHSLKDVPGEETPGLQLTTFLPREDPRDVWVSQQDDLMHLKVGGRIGTSSLRRQLLVQLYRNDVQLETLRGNVDTRLRKLREGQYDAVIVAAAGLHRLQLFDESYMHYLSEEAFIPAIGQAIMVVQTTLDPDLIEIVRSLNEPHAELAAKIERSFIVKYEGGCHLPVGGHAVKRGDLWHFHAFIGGIRTGRIIQEIVESEDPDFCAPAMYERLEQLGARDLLAELE